MGSKIFWFDLPDKSNNNRGNYKDQTGIKKTKIMAKTKIKIETKIAKNQFTEN